MDVEPRKSLAGWLRQKEESWGVFAVPLSVVPTVGAGLIICPAFTESSSAWGHFMCVI